MPVPRKLSSLRKATGCRKGLLDPTMNGGGSLPCEWNIPTEAAAAVLASFAGKPSGLWSTGFSEHLRQAHF